MKIKVNVKFTETFLLFLDSREDNLEEFVPAQLEAMVIFHQQNAWLTYRKIDRSSNWFSVTWKFLVAELNALGTQHDQDYWIAVWDHQVALARIVLGFGDELNQNQLKILKLISE